MEKKFIPLSVPNLSGRELEYVTKAVETEWVSTAGPYVEQFEKDIAAYLGVSCACACQSGTSGLHIALLLCGAQPGDLIIVPTLTFIAAVNPVRYIGAEPVFMDCDDSLCMDPEKLRRFCEEDCERRNGELFHKASGRRIPALIVVHVFGNMAEIGKIMDIAAEYGLRVIEDATEALGTKFVSGKYAGRFAGTIGDVGVFSFNGNKIITTGGGGMIVCADENMTAHAKHLTTQAKSDTENFIHDEIGYNYRLTNIQAALGVAQLEQLEDFISVKERNYRIYKEALDGAEGLRILDFREGTRPNKWFYSLVCESPYPLGRSALISALKSRGVQTRPIWGLIHEQKPYEGSLCCNIEKAVYYQRRVVNLPCSTSLTEDDARCVAGLIKELGKK